MGFLRSIEDHGHHILTELEDHVVDFHAGLEHLEERLSRRHEVVTSRLASLEGEQTDVAAGLARINELKRS